MLRIYGAALDYGIQICDDDSVDQIGANVGYCLECDDDKIILLAMRVAKTVLLGAEHLEPEVLGELALHQNPEIAKLVGEMLGVVLV
jgi:hypothetical protein